ncbi:hypothetical protein [Halobellus limi]|uniref:Uncharacterized protein n=1 Tax=Halobellus limi TaxID=699433 RepID=A0A1H5VV78_9EURY|nr:hypothetical protein [Halobellus limi]QCC46615.1 hypothetical protein DV707_02410 [Halobellus limi]SEF90878.1 hypothetical protein SAMN04488133_1073 [Halobellus limi]
MVDSDWWVGVALPPLLEVLGWIGLELLFPESGGSPTAFDFVPAVFVLVSMLLIPVFAVSLFFDARAVGRSAESWSPNYRLWGVVGIVVPIAGLALVDSPLLLFVGSAYLLRRWRSTETSGDVASDVYDGDGWYDTTDENTSREADAPHETGSQRSGRVSRWYYGVALTVATYAVVLVSAPIVFATLGTPDNAAFVYDVAPSVGALLPFVLVLSLVGGVLLIPVFSLSLYLDARAVDESDADWSPDRRVWTGVAVAHLCNILLPFVWMVSVPAGGYYLWQRHRRIGRP